MRPHRVPFTEIIRIFVIHLILKRFEIITLARAGAIVFGFLSISAAY